MEKKQKVKCTCKPWRDIDGTHHQAECDLTMVYFFQVCPICGSELELDYTCTSCILQEIDWQEVSR